MLTTQKSVLPVEQTLLKVNAQTAAQRLIQVYIARNVELSRVVSQKSV